MLGLLVVGGILLPLILAARYLMQSTRFAGPNAVMAETMEIFYRCANWPRLQLQQLSLCSASSGEGWRGMEVQRLGALLCGGVKEEVGRRCHCMCSPRSRPRAPCKQQPSLICRLWWRTCWSCLNTTEAAITKVHNLGQPRSASSQLASPAPDAPAVTGPSLGSRSRRAWPRSPTP